MKCLNTNRNNGLDFLRILLAFFIVFIHMSNSSNGGALTYVDNGTLNYYIIWGMLSICYPAVNCYALMSGYLGFGKNHSLKKPLLIWLQLLFYSVLIGLFFFFVKGAPTVKLFKSLLPLNSEAWWYVNCYLVLCIFAPLLDKWVSEVSFIDFKRTVLVLFAMFCLTNTVFLHKDVFFLYDGYSPLWLIYLYLVGAGIKKYNLFSRISHSKWGYIWVGSTLITFSSRLVLDIIVFRIFGDYKGSGLLYHYLSFTCVIAAISALGYFATIKERKHHILWKTIAIGSFAAYLVHVHPLIKEYYWEGTFSFYGKGNAFNGLGIMILIDAGIVIIVSLFDVGRQWLFLKIDNQMQKIIKRGENNEIL